MHTTTTIRSNADDAGKLLLRASLALILLFHGYAKLTGGIGFVADMLAKVGAPAALGYLVYVGEVIAPLMLLALSIFTRPAALVVAGNMIVAVLLVHTSQIFTLNETGGWALELQGMFFVAAVAVALLGA
ncbi:DoxX family protein [Massilia sp. H-1]|nr:DoxX family protein [Massilia sp. H-1]